MPLYQYVCQECDAEFETLVNRSVTLSRKGASTSRDRSRLPRPSAARSASCSTRDNDS